MVYCSLQWVVSFLVFQILQLCYAYLVFLYFCITAIPEYENFDKYSNKLKSCNWPLNLLSLVRSRRTCCNISIWSLKKRKQTILKTTQKYKLTSLFHHFILFANQTIHFFLNIISNGKNIAMVFSFKTNDDVFCLIYFLGNVSPSRYFSLD